MTKILRILLLVSLPLIYFACYDNPSDAVVGNQAPETHISLLPDSSISSQPSKLKVSWWGDDPDGLIVGFYYTWNGTDWKFSQSNDSLFTLKIGISDTTYLFQVSAVDDGGNGVFDNQVIQNNINYGPEPFTDQNGNGVHDPNEPFIDIGLIDPTPASLDFPIKNSAPVIAWNTLSVIPDTSFPVMSFGWNASDIDGESTIEKINIALNDTAESNRVSLLGGVRTVTLRTNDFNSDSPQMDVLIDGSENNKAAEKLNGLKLNDNNKFFVQAVDISGAKSNWIALPDSGNHWYVKKPKGKVLIVDDYTVGDNSAQFYSAMFDSLGLKGKYDIYDFHTQKPPYLNVTFYETLKLYEDVFWYSDNNPSLDLAAGVVQKYLDRGGKIAFSLQFPQTVDLSLVQSFLPINADSSDFKISLIGGTTVTSDNNQYPDLTLTTSIFRVRSFYLNPFGNIPLYSFSKNELKGYIGFTNSDKSLFFIGLPLNKMNGGPANVKALLHKVFFEDFGLTP